MVWERELLYFPSCKVKLLHVQLTSALSPAGKGVEQPSPPAPPEAGMTAAASSL